MMVTSLATIVSGGDADLDAAAAHVAGRTARWDVIVLVHTCHALPSLRHLMRIPSAGGHTLSSRAAGVGVTRVIPLTPGDRVWGGLVAGDTLTHWVPKSGSNVIL